MFSNWNFTTLTWKRFVKKWLTRKKTVKLSISTARTVANYGDSGCCLFGNECVCCHLPSTENSLATWYLAWNLNVETTSSQRLTLPQCWKTQYDFWKHDFSKKLPLPSKINLVNSFCSFRPLISGTCSELLPKCVPKMRCRRQWSLIRIRSEKPCVDRLHFARRLSARTIGKSYSKLSVSLPVPKEWLRQTLKIGFHKKWRPESNDFVA